MLHREKHVDHILEQIRLLDAPVTLEGAAEGYIKTSGVYWGLGALAALGELDSGRVRAAGVTREAVVAYLRSCLVQTKGIWGFGGREGHDGHLLYTTSALQAYSLYGPVSELLSPQEVQELLRSLSALQDRESGCFYGDYTHEVDTRFTYCALLSAALLLGARPGVASSPSAGTPEEAPARVPAWTAGDLPASLAAHFDLDAAERFLLACQNPDGGFGAVPGAESHAGQVCCCVAALALMGRLETLREGCPRGDALRLWLAFRQGPTGGLSGRPEKDPDVCYSWWVGAPARLLLGAEVPRGEPLRQFVLRCQDRQTGGISDRPENQPDAYHTFFGVFALSLYRLSPDLAPVDPVFALPLQEGKS